MTDLLASEISPAPQFTGFGDLIWTIKDEQRLMNTYPTRPKKTLLQLFPDRTWIAIRQKARRLMLRQGPKRWTKDEQTLLELLAERTRDFLLISLLFPDRSPDSVRTRYYRFVRNGQ